MTDSYSQDLIARVRQAENYRGDFGTMVFSQIIVDMIQYQDHINRLMLHGIRKMAESLRGEVQP